jgi:hypothetical protein
VDAVSDAPLAFRDHQQVVVWAREGRLVGPGHQQVVVWAREGRLVGPGHQQVVEGRP